MTNARPAARPLRASKRMKNPKKDLHVRPFILIFSKQGGKLK